MGRCVVWIEQLSGSREGFTACSAPIKDVVRWQFLAQPRYSTAEEALEDFIVVHWAMFGSLKLDEEK